MCGRFTTILEPDELAEELNLGQVAADYAPRYNVAPTQPVPFVWDDKTRNVELYHWGLIPPWAKDREIGGRLINARAETIRERPAFKQAFLQRRGLVLATGFYEWKKVGNAKNPFYFQLVSQRAFPFAGLWETWVSPQGEMIHSCTIITCAANDLMAPIHDRMPVILEKKDMEPWLDPRTPPEIASSLLKPYPADRMEKYPVSQLVNNPRVDLPECIQPI